MNAVVVTPLGTPWEPASSLPARPYQSLPVSKSFLYVSFFFLRTVNLLTKHTHTQMATYPLTILKFRWRREPCSVALPHRRALRPLPADSSGSDPPAYRRGPVAARWPPPQGWCRLTPGSWPVGHVYFGMNLHLGIGSPPRFLCLSSAHYFSSKMTMEEAACLSCSFPLKLRRRWFIFHFYFLEVISV